MAVGARHYGGIRDQARDDPQHGDTQLLVSSVMQA